MTKGSVTHVTVRDKTKSKGKCDAKSCGKRDHNHWRIAFSYDVGQGRVQKTGWRFHTKSEGQDALDDWRSACRADPALLSLSYGDWRKGKTPKVDSTIQGAEQTFRAWAASWLKGKVAAQEHRGTTAEAASKYLLGKPRPESDHEPKVCIAETLVRGGSVRFGDLPLAEITWQDVHQVIREEAKGRDKGGFYRTYSLRGWSYLGPCLRKAAVTYDLDPRIGDRNYVEPPKLNQVQAATAKERRANGAGHERPAWERCTLEHAEAALKHVAGTRDSQWFAIVRLVLDIGLRRAEVCGLRWRDVDLDNRVVHVRTSRWETSNGQVGEDEPKSKAGRRDVSISCKARDALLAWAKDQAVLLGTDVAPEDGYVFTSDLGGPWRPKAMSEVQWRAIARELTDQLGLPGPVPFHALRKISGGFGLSYFGESLYAVSKRLGHSNIKVTQDCYANLTKDVGASHADARDARMAI